MAARPPERLVVGTLGRAVGLRGEIEVRVVSEDPSRFDAGSVLESADGARFTVRRTRTHRDRTIVTFEHVPDRTAAEALRGVTLYVPADAARPLQDGEYWDHDLIGCDVVASSGTGPEREVGRVTDVLHTAANDVLEVRAATATHLIPMVGAVVKAVDLEHRRITIDPLPGLLDDD